MYFSAWKPGWDHSLATIFIPAFCISFWMIGQCPTVEVPEDIISTIANPAIWHNTGDQSHVLIWNMETHVESPSAFTCLVAGCSVAQSRNARDGGLVGLSSLEVGSL